MSITLTVLEPSAIEGLVSTRVVIPNRRAMSATVLVPTCWASRAATVFTE